MDDLLHLIRQADRTDGMPVIALAHNEANLIEPFLAHYRSLGATHLVIVDDRSDDGTAELLAAQQDVTVIRPAEGSTFGRDKLLWRAALLDRYAAGRWALLPDLDEHLVFAGMERQGLDSYLARLDAEGAEAVLCVMIDMYADRPLSEHHYGRDEPRSLVDAFPFFDGPGQAPFGYHFLLGSKKARRRSATPPLSVHGGLRDRLFRVPGLRTGPLALRLLDSVAALDGPVTPGTLDMLKLRATRRITRNVFRGALDMHKIGLLRWRRGSVYEGAHRLREPYAMSESIAAFLHFKFTRGVAGLEYIAGRGQHFGGARHYREMLDAREVLERSPVFAGSRRYQDSGSLSGIVRDVPAR